ncbi:MAG TPA: sugar phosphate nucleotidyltransferase [Pyrinomonadaceae bacterium]|nr:sugar phosphate nucleotidyltransferase [Pyrinomonadaceae bacterium]
MKLSEIRSALAQLVTEGHPALTQRRERLNTLCAAFFKQYGDGDVSLLRAPARINILGEHIDYVSYLPTASLTFGSRERDALMLYRKRTEPEIRCASTSPAFTSSSFLLSEDSVEPFGEDVVGSWLAFLAQHGTPEPHWQNYIKGAVQFARGKFGKQIVNGFDFVLDSNIPAGGGASSSSALVVLGGAAIREVNEVSFTAAELAYDSSLAEWYIGTRGGSMDHITICLAQPSSAVLINYSTHQTKRLTLPDKRFAWLTFFSKPANKGHEVMIEYNERAAVSRLLIPALIDGWRKTDPQRHHSWTEAISSFNNRSLAALDMLEELLISLPQTISITTLQSEHPEVFLQFEQSFPALLNETTRWPLPIRTRSLHHLGEVRRVALAQQTLESIQQESTPETGGDAMRRIGELSNESHASLRDLYNVSTNDVEQIIDIVRSDPNVLGARLMGGGFGGNVLVLTTSAHANSLIERVQTEYYAPQSRNGVGEGSVMISTPGRGLGELDLNDIWRETFVHVNSLGAAAGSHVGHLCSLLDTLPIEIDPQDVWPVIVAAGRGTRAADLSVPKPLAQVGEKPAIVHVLDNVRAGLGQTRPPVVIVSPETEAPIREQLRDREVIFVTQPQARGTGDAVLQAQTVMHDFDGLALVVWSTQPVIRPATFKRAVKLARLFNSYEMVIPTTLRDAPYAPIQRDENGAVQSAVETHLENAEKPDFGETNIGMFLLKNQTMFAVLRELRERLWNHSHGRYDRDHGELGFPNEMINNLAQRHNGVFAGPIADWREEQGIKKIADVTACASFIAKMQEEDFS